MQSLDFSLFNTLNTIRASTTDEDLLTDVKRRCRKWERLFSRFDPESELYRINDAKGKPVNVDPELASFIESALGYCAEVDGLFDITMGAVTRLWDFGNKVIPDKGTVSEALEHVDYRKVHVDGTTVCLEDPEAVLELGGIAKGYIADGIINILKEHGVEHSLVNLGGNVAVSGGREDGEPFGVGIRQPAPSMEAGIESVFAAVRLTDGSVVTSGIYERMFVQDGRLYHHILDRRTGFPAKTDVVSATIVSSRSLDGDGYSTALVLMGADAALQFAMDHPGLEVIIVTNEGEVLATPGIGTTYPFQMIGQS